MRWARSPSASRSTRFAIVDVANGDLAGKPKNVLGLLFREEQVGYLAGYLAGLEAKRKPGKDVISSVAGEKQPPVDRFIAGYQAGAKKADPKITVANAYSQDFTDQAKCKSIALNQISAGSLAVFAVAGACGLGALDAARERNVWGIGVDADQSFLGPQILTSATKKVDRAVFLAVQVGAKGHLPRRQCRLRSPRRGRRARQDQPEGAEDRRSRRSSGSGSS